jgi:CPA1 family monovalent cation:H+ antiporter
MVSLLIALGGVSSYINYRYIKLRTTVGVVLVALFASLMLVLLGSHAAGFREQAGAMIARIDIDQVVLHGMLAFLLFAGAIKVNIDDIRREWLTILSLAIFGALASTLLVGAATWLVLGWLGLGRYPLARGRRCGVRAHALSGS